MEIDIIKQAMSIMGKRSAEKRRLDPNYNEIMRKMAQKPRGTKGKKRKTIEAQQ